MVGPRAAGLVFDTSPAAVITVAHYFMKSEAKDMRRLFAACLALASFFGAEAASADTLAITHIEVIDATGAPPQRDMTVIVRDGRIAELGASDAVRVPAD